MFKTGFKGILSRIFSIIRTIETRLFGVLLAFRHLLLIVFIIDSELLVVYLTIAIHWCIVKHPLLSWYGDCIVIALGFIITHKLEKSVHDLKQLIYIDVACAFVYGLEGLMEAGNSGTWGKNDCTMQAKPNSLTVPNTDIFNHIRTLLTYN